MSVGLCYELDCVPQNSYVGSSLFSKRKKVIIYISHYTFMILPFFPKKNRLIPLFCFEA